MKEKFDGHFVKRRNVIFERAKFNLHKQLQRETVHNFITDLFCSADHCAYRREEMIRDQIVVGLLDASLSEKIQLEAELTLDTALTMACQSKVICKQ